MWEFPGGKVEAGEAPEQALARELREELGVAAQVGPEVYRTRHQYPEMPEALELIFFAASAVPGEICKICNLVFEQIHWCTPSALLEFDFLPADRELIAQLASGALALPRQQRP
jgi:8-oxo-dGTP diphosphatase